MSTGPALRDLRAAITETADQVLEAMSIATGQTKQELVRRVLDDWAEQRIHESTLVLRFVPGNGKPRSPVE